MPPALELGFCAFGFPPLSIMAVRSRYPAGSPYWASRAEKSGAFPSAFIVSFATPCGLLGSTGAVTPGAAMLGAAPGAPPISADSTAPRAVSYSPFNSASRLSAFLLMPRMAKARPMAVSPSPTLRGVPMFAAMSSSAIRRLLCSCSYVHGVLPPKMKAIRNNPPAIHPHPARTTRPEGFAAAQPAAASPEAAGYSSG